MFRPRKNPFNDGKATPSTINSIAITSGGNSIHLNLGDTLPVQAAAFAANGAQLSGSVKEGTNGPPVSGASILLYPTDAQLIGPNSRYIRTAKSGQQGEFSIQGLVPGEYKLCAVLDHESGAEFDTEFLQSLDRVAKSVTLNAGQTASETLEASASPARD